LYSYSPFEELITLCNECPDFVVKADNLTFGDVEDLVPAASKAPDGFGTPGSSPSVGSFKGNNHEKITTADTANKNTAYSRQTEGLVFRRKFLQVSKSVESGRFSGMDEIY
jgi:hypothetical protein